MHFISYLTLRTATNKHLYYYGRNSLVVVEKLVRLCFGLEGKVVNDEIVYLAVYPCHTDCNVLLTSLVFISNQAKSSSLFISIYSIVSLSNLLTKTEKTLIEDKPYFLNLYLKNIS